MAASSPFAASAGASASATATVIRISWTVCWKVTALVSCRGAASKASTGTSGGPPSFSQATKPVIPACATSPTQDRCSAGMSRNHGSRASHSASARVEARRRPARPRSRSRPRPGAHLGVARRQPAMSAGGRGFGSAARRATSRPRQAGSPQGIAGNRIASVRGPGRGPATDRVPAGAAARADVPGARVPAGGRDAARRCPPPRSAARAAAGTLAELPGLGKVTAEVVTEALAGEEPGLPAAAGGRAARPVAEGGAGAAAGAARRLHIALRLVATAARPIEEMAPRRAALGHDYVVLTDHSPRLTVARGLSAERLREQLDVVAGLNERPGAVPAAHRHRGRHPRRRLARPGAGAARPGSTWWSASVHSKLRMRRGDDDPADGAPPSRTRTWTCSATAPAGC